MFMNASRLGGLLTITVTSCLNISNADTYMSWVWLLCEQTDDNGGGSSKKGEKQREVHVVKVLQDGGPDVLLSTTPGVVIHKR